MATLEIPGFQVSSGLLGALAALGEFAASGFNWSSLWQGPLMPQNFYGRPKALDTINVIQAYNKSAYNPLHSLAQDLLIALRNGAPISDSRPEVQAQFSAWKQGTAQTLVSPFAVRSPQWWLALNLLNQSWADAASPQATLRVVRALDELQINVASQPNTTMTTCVPSTFCQRHPKLCSEFSQSTSEFPTIVKQDAESLFKWAEANQPLGWIGKYVGCLIVSQANEEAGLLCFENLTRELVKEEARIWLRAIKDWLRSHARTHPVKHQPEHDPPVPRGHINMSGPTLSLNPTRNVGKPMGGFPCGCDQTEFEEEV